ncbi:FAD-binding oxidoreductase [Paenibacillus tritici]|uniref:NAD(P)/FAD-dependent oxidoreductase n=1 Tax=Paenibacillus tritici TaxID=1873425 RepID=UPI001BA6543D|nr:FAD-dependent oxidoreductase [Paenibacillus tritici]QUL57074.1 FAD-binding oxidoreductase [Paenibacillus tritici]
MDNKHIFDVVVVGNGILGLSLALTLARKKMRVALVGESARPWAASTAAGAMLGCFGEVTSSLLKNEYGRMKHDFAVRALSLWDNWLDEMEDNQGNTNIRVANGTVVILNAIGYSKVDDINFEAIRDSLKHYREPFEDIDPRDVEWLDPYPLSRPGRSIYIPNEHAVNSINLLQRLEKSFLSLGGKLITESGVRLESNAGQVDALVLNSGERLVSNKIVLAAGVKSQELLNSVPEIAAHIPRLVSGRGISALISTADGSTPNSVIRTPNRAFACGLHVLPRQKGEVYIGATNAIAPKVVEYPKIGNVASLLETGYRQIRRDLYNGQLNRIQIGNRPVSLDGYPLLGETGLSGLWIMTGTYRDGLTLSPYLAREMTKLICGEEADPDLKMFNPVRAPIQPYTREEIIKETVEHTLATGYETDWRIQAGWHDVIENDMYSFYEKFTNDLHPSFTPPADILVAAGKHMSVRKILFKYYNNIP